MLLGVVDDGALGGVGGDDRPAAPAPARQHVVVRTHAQDEDPEADQVRPVEGLPSHAQ